MSRRRREAMKSATRARAAHDKSLRRRVRHGRRSGGAASATAAAAVTLAGITTAFASPAEVAVAEVPSAGCPSPPAPSGAPDELVVLGDTLYFTANDGTHGRELWKSDGTEAGTTLVKNINPNDSARRPGSAPQGLTAVGDTLFFAANDGTRGRELWRSDGTTSGTVLVKDIHPSASGDPDEITPLGGQFFFSADDGKAGRELWRSDGTRAGTALVKNIAPPRTENYYGPPHYLTARGKRVFFAADDGPHGVELWRSNGTRDGTVMVRNIDTREGNDDPDYPGSMPHELTVAGGRLYFAAWNDTTGDELWRSDGSRAGTVLVKDIDPRQRRSSSPFWLAGFGDRLFFAATDASHDRELWRSDASSAGTVMVKNIEPDDAGGYDAGGNPSQLTPAGAQLFFVADDGTTGEGLWKSDGTRAGTALVKNLDLSGADGYPAAMEASADRLFFTAATGTPGLGLWTSDGSAAGTVIVKDFDSCDDSYYPRESRPRDLTAQGGRLFFAAEDVAHGEELWVSDGTPEGTELVKDIRSTAP